jgi:aspartyl/glutamyl-tRNA(Asn/Gln) amidotransferase C subunit
MASEIDVGKVARAARIRLTEAEAAKFSREIGQILDNFRKINEVCVDGVEPSFNPIRAEAKLRADEVEKWDFDPLANARFVKGRKVAGPKVFG